MGNVVGAALIIAACGGVGLMYGRTYCRQIQQIQGILNAVQWMEWELACRQTPLQELLMGSSRISSGDLAVFFAQAGENLRQCTQAQPCFGMRQALEAMEFLPETSMLLEELCHCFGQFDLQGQLQQLQAFRGHAHAALNELEKNREAKQRISQTMGFGIGAALVILLL